jgi:hypothetical protein
MLAHAEMRALLVRMFMRPPAYHYDDHDRQFSLVIVRIEGTERRIGVYFRAEGGWQMDAQIAQL